MDDIKIINLFWIRDENAINHTENKYGGYLYTIANNILFSKEDSQECVNDTYLKIWNTIPPEKPKFFKSFIGKIARNLAIDKYRFLKSEKRGSGKIDLLLDELGEVLAGDHDVESSFDEKYLIELINEFLRGLPYVKRKLFILRYFYAFSIRDIGKEMSMSDSAIHTSLHRIRVDLRDYLVKGGIDL